MSETNYINDTKNNPELQSLNDDSPPLNFCRCSDVLAAHDLERLGFPESEAASLEALKFRQREAPELFFGAFENSEITGRLLVGYITSTQSSAERIIHDSMTTHDAEGPLVVLHSVCVHPHYQRRGIATQLMKTYLSHLRDLKSELPIRRVALLSHQPLVSWYEGFGFQNQGLSPVSHGADPWFELVLKL